MHVVPTCLCVALQLSLPQVVAGTLNHVLQSHNAGVQGRHKLVLDGGIRLRSSNTADINTNFSSAADPYDKETSTPTTLHSQGFDTLQAGYVFVFLAR